MASSQAIALKENLATNTPKILTIKKRAGTYPATDYTTKEPIPGSFIHLYIFHDETGQEFKYYASDLEQSVLEDYKPGEQVCVVRVEKVKEDGKRIYFQQWGSPDSAEMTAAPQIKSTSAVVQQGRDKDEFEKKQEAREMRISLAGLMQAHICAGKQNDEALKQAIVGKQMLDAHVESVLSIPL